MKAEVKQFWEETFKALDQINPAPKEVGKRSDYYIILKEIVLRSWKNIRFQGMLVIPRSVLHIDKAIIFVGGSGVHNGYKPRPQFWFEDAATFMVDPRGQGHSRMDIEHLDHFTHGIRKKETYRYRGVYCDIRRAVDYLTGIGYERIGMGGVCFGGGIAVAMAALDKRINAVIADTPWPCNIKWAVEHKIPGYDMLWKYLEKFPNLREEIYQTLEYYDPVLLADEVTAPTLIGMNTVDPRVHSFTMRSLFNAIKGTKGLIEYGKEQHGCSPDFNLHQTNWFKVWL